MIDKVTIVRTAGQEWKVRYQMRIVIEIDEDLYEMCRDSLGDEDNIEGIIANGIPLPKGHGRLIDADKLIQEYRTSNIVSIYGEQIVIKVYRAPTIIAADKAESEEL